MSQIFRYCGLLCNSGSPDSPIWEKLETVKKIDISNEDSIEFEIEKNSVGFTVIKNAFCSNSPIEFAIAGPLGSRASMVITNFVQNEPLEEKITFRVTAIRLINRSELRSIYSNSSYIKQGEIASHFDRVAVQNARREYGLQVIGEVWQQGTGYVLLFSGPDLDQDTMKLLCIRKRPITRTN